MWSKQSLVTLKGYKKCFSVTMVRADLIAVDCYEKPSSDPGKNVWFLINVNKPDVIPQVMDNW